MIARTTRRVAAKFGSSLPRSSLKFLRQELERLLEKVQKRSERIADLENQEPTETRRPARTPRASSPPDSHGRGERPKSAAAGTLPALRAKAAAKVRPSDNGGGATTASGDGDSGD